ncbi:MAG: right-handed parallel beta-helix repeat-containing protein [Promethearchaeota archaeon]
MNQFNIIILSILLLGLINWTTDYNKSTTAAFSPNKLIKTHTTPVFKSTNSQIYTPHSPIVITANSHFISQGFLGAGTLENPYRIEHLNISASSGNLVLISDTTVHFRISDIYLDGLVTATSGVSLFNVQHATVENNTITSSEDGIRINNAPKTVILNNNIYSNTRFGIFLDKTDNCTLSSNSVHDNLINGVHLKDTLNTTINHNTIYNHHYGEYSQCGILLDNSSNTLIANNSIFNNHYGIKLLNSANNNQVTNNTLYDNQQQGICLEYASGNTLVYNNISNNLFYGILITDGSNDNTIQYNSFTGNKAGTNNTQASDNGINNVFKGNFWDDWAPHDDNDDLIIDIPYPIEGTANNSDSFPLRVLSIQAIENINKRPDYSGILIFLIVVMVGIVISTGGGYFLYTSRFKEPEIEEPFTDFESSDQIDRLKPLYHKIVVGLENIQALTLPEPATVPLLKPAETITLIEYFPADIKKDLRSGLKWRTVLTLIEIAYQDPSDTNPAQLAQNMDIPRSTLSKEIKRLTDLGYIESFITFKVLHDARFHNYMITSKGFKLLYILKEAFKLAIARIKEKQGEVYA